MKKECSFCGRSEREVKLLISGLSGYICEDCAQQAYRIVQENLVDDKKDKAAGGKSQLKKVPKPKEIRPISMTISSDRMRPSVSSL